MTIYAISDTHFGHAKIVELSGRPEDFSERILKNLATLNGDILIHCGDFALCGSREYEEWTKRFMDASAGFKRKVFVRGNHDNKSDSWYYAHGWDFVCTSFHAEIFSRLVVFSHKPIPRHMVPQAFVNIHGHTHGNTHRLSELAVLAAFHKDLAPEIRNYKAVNVQSLLATS